MGLDDVRFRLTYSHDIRAPNLTELFAAGTAGSQNVIINGSPQLVTAITRGNTNLTPEAANSLGVGAVLTPTFIPGLQASVDYFNINLAHRIGTVTLQQTADLCYIDHVQAYCNTFLPPPAGTVIPQVNIQPINFASVKEEGIDFDATYRVPLDEINFLGTIPGSLLLHGLATNYLRAYTNDGIDLPYDIAGNNADSGLNGVGGLPSWVYRIESTYSANAWTLDLIGRGVSAGKVAQNYIQCTTGCPLPTQANPTINNNSVSGAFYTDATIAYDVNAYGADAELFFNVKNLFNLPPVVVPTGGNSTIVTTALQPQTNTGIYDVLGRVFRVGVRTRF
jgi:outer membrane receptor protein involved in Fe transport